MSKLVIIGSARIDERGRLSGGAAGDQKQSQTPDYKGEVSLQPFYVHSKGWIAIRAKRADHAERLASNMEIACNNQNIGYDQNRRLEITVRGVKTPIRTGCDCSSLVRECAKEATGTDPGNFTTANEKSALLKTGLFQAIPYTKGMILYKGDILVTQTKGHTAIVVCGESRKATKNVTEIAREVIAGKWGNGEERKRRLRESGYDPEEVQKAVNKILKY